MALAVYVTTGFFAFREPFFNLDVRRWSSLIVKILDPRTQVGDLRCTELVS